MKRVLGSFGFIGLVIPLTSGCAGLNDHVSEHLGGVNNRQGVPTYEEKVSIGTVLQSLQLDSELAERILALDPERISEKDVREVLARGPTPRIILIHGSGLPGIFVSMESFSTFLMGMGYPENKIRNPRDGAVSYSSYKSSAEFAGMIAWYYETEGLPVMLIGYSSGGIQAVKVLHELAGTFNDKVSVWNPLAEKSEDRNSIIDPITGQEQAVVGLRVGYAAVAAAGGLVRLIPSMWSMLGRLRDIPDSVEHFTGASVGVDGVGGDFFGFVPGANDYVAGGRAKVRNVHMPASYRHGRLFNTDHLPKDPKIRDWINAYQPSERPELTAEFEAPSDNILLAADVWYSIKKQWCLEAQRFVRAKSAPAHGG